MALAASTFFKNAWVSARVINMAATLHRFRSNQDKLTDNQAGDLRQLLLDFSIEKGMPQDAISRVLGSIDQRTASASGWTFVMLSPQQNNEVVSYLSDNSNFCNFIF